MFRQTLPLLVVFLLALLQQTTAQTVGTTPFLACTLTTFGCPKSSGCCPIGGCCGSGCCPIGYACLNEGTSSQSCCPSFDTTKCGTVTPPVNNGGGGSTVKNCNTAQACPMDPVRKLGWTCTLGKTCGLSYNQCYACPYIFNIGASSSVAPLPPASTTTLSPVRISTTTVALFGFTTTSSLGGGALSSGSSSAGGSTSTSFAGGTGETTSTTTSSSPRSSTSTSSSARSSSSSSSGGGRTAPPVGMRVSEAGTVCLAVVLGAVGLVMN